MITKIKRRDLISILGIFILSIFYMIFRVNDLTPLSDEIYFYSEDLKRGDRRWFFTSFVQLFNTFEDALILVFTVNILLLVPIYFSLLHLNEDDSLVTFVQMIYLTTLTSYILRDILVLCLTLIALVLILNYHKCKYRLISSIILPVILFILFSSKMQYVFFLLAAILVAFFAEKAPKKFAFTCLLFCCLFLLTSNWMSLLSNASIYSISIIEFINLRAEKFGYELNSSGFSYVFLKHIFAPIPFSLLDRFFYPDLSHPLIDIDDIFRFVYRTCLYICIFYLILNIGSAIEYIKNNRFLIFLILTISMLNIVTYSIFTGGGGHERSKILSVLIIFAITSGVRAIKKNKFRSKVHKT